MTDLRAVGEEDAISQSAVKGKAPGCAAEIADIARSTAYVWKADDAAFAALWVEAVECSLDRLETKEYDLAMDGNMERDRMAAEVAAQKQYQNTKDHTPATSMTNYFLNMTVQEQFERLERLGLPVPVIESDEEYEEK